MRDRRTWRPSVAGLLLLGQIPQAYLPSARVRVLRYSGTDRTTGVQLNTQADVTCDGTLADQVECACKAISAELPAATRLAPTGRFTAAPLLPEAAWLEAVVNAVAHRNYAYGGDYIRVDIFTDRIEVSSPGGFPGFVNERNARGSHFARNPAISRVMSDLGYGREIGEGLRRMDRELEAAGFAPAVLRGGGNSVVVTLLFESVWQRVMALASADAGRFVDHLRQHDRVTAAEAEDLLGVSRPTSNSFLKRLVAAKLLERIASSPYDRNVHWIVRRGAQSGGAHPRSPVVSTRRVPRCEFRYELHRRLAARRRGHGAGRTRPTRSSRRRRLPRRQSVSQAHTARLASGSTAPSISARACDAPEGADQASR